MMTVGHTHEDIDSCFQRISGFRRRAGRVLNPVAFLELLRQAVPQSHVYPILTYVHDWKGLLSDEIYQRVSGITKAREFIIKERDDKGVP